VEEPASATAREIARLIGAIERVVARRSGGTDGDLPPVARATGHPRRQRRALQFGGFPQWWPPSQALQRQVQDPLVAMRIVVQLLTVRVLPVRLTANSRLWADINI